MAEPPSPSGAEQAAVDRELAAIEARYGDRLDDAGRAVIAARLLELQRIAAAVRAVPLTMADEPLPAGAPWPTRDAR
jgi:hypothetical protein